MPFSESWVESDPDGSVIHVSDLDDYIRAAKRQIRNRLEGDQTNPNSGIFELGSFATTAIVKAGAGRIYAVQASGLGGLMLQDGRMAITTDTNKLYHLKATGLVEISYANLDGSRAFTGSVSFNAGIVVTGSITASSLSIGSISATTIATTGVISAGGLISSSSGPAFTTAYWTKHFGLYNGGAIEFGLNNASGTHSWLIGSTTVGAPVGSSGFYIGYTPQRDGSGAPSYPLVITTTQFSIAIVTAVPQLLVNAPGAGSEALRVNGAGVFIGALSATGMTLTGALTVTGGGITVSAGGINVTGLAVLNNGLTITGLLTTSDVLVSFGSTLALDNYGDSPVQPTGRLGMVAKTASTASAGSSGAVPSQVRTYLRWNLGGTYVKIPVFND